MPRLLVLMCLKQGVSLQQLNGLAAVLPARAIPAKVCPGGGGMKMVDPEALLLLLSLCFSARFCISLTAASRSARTCTVGISRMAASFHQCTKSCHVLHVR